MVIGRSLTWLSHRSYSGYFAGFEQASWQDDFSFFRDIYMLLSFHISNYLVCIKLQQFSWVWSERKKNIFVFFPLNILNLQTLWNYFEKPVSLNWSSYNECEIFIILCDTLSGSNPSPLSQGLGCSSSFFSAAFAAHSQRDSNSSEAQTLLLSIC